MPMRDKEERKQVRWQSVQDGWRWAPTKENGRKGGDWIQTPEIAVRLGVKVSFVRVHWAGEPCSRTPVVFSLGLALVRMPQWIAEVLGSWGCQLIPLLLALSLLKGNLSGRSQGLCMLSYFSTYLCMISSVLLLSKSFL